MAETLTARAHQICPYSKATRGNIAVEINIV
jgi:lipoyl-dependent peroxiredoxin